MTRINLLPHPAATERRLLWAFVRAYDAWQQFAGLPETRARDSARMMLAKARKALGDTP